MGKTVFMFAGQGAQYVGMGKDFYDTYACCKQIYELAESVTGLPVADICFKENEQINETKYTQIAMVTTEAAILAALEQENETCDAAAGLSLGEYGALITSKAMRTEDAFLVVKSRGLFMQEAYPVGGAMSAVLGLEQAAIEQICERTPGIVSIANYNCPGQIVITGEKVAVEQAGEALKEAGAKRIVPLKVSGPFHSQLLKDAGEKLAEVLKEVQMQEIELPYLANVHAQYVTKKEDIKDLLAKQVSSSVRWQQTIEKLLADGFDTFVEIGPGKTLSGFMKKMSKDVTVYNIQNVEDLKKYVNR